MQGKALLGESERKGYEKKLEDWRTEGFDVSRLAGILKSAPHEAAGAFETAEKGIHRNRELLHELEEPGGIMGDEAASNLRELLKDPWRSGEAENLLLEFQVQEERKKKEAQRKERDRERRLGRLREKVLAWKGQGYATAGLEALLDKDADAAGGELERFEEGVSRLKAVEEELSAVDTADFEEDRKSIEAMLRDTARAQEAEDAIIHLRIRIEKAGKAKRARAEQEKRDRAKLREKVRAWMAAGQKIPLPDDLIDNAPMDELNERVEELEEAMVRQDELRDELGRMELQGHDAEKEGVLALLNDPSQVRAAEERLLRLQLASQRAARERERRAEESRRWRQELQSRVTELKGAGYDTARLDEAFGRDDEALRTEWVKYRIQLKRVQELEAELRAIPSEGFEQEVGSLVARLRNVSIGSIEEVQYGIRSINGRIAARREQELREREAEKREKEELTGKLMKWVGEGYREGKEGKLEKMVSFGLPRMREELSGLEGRIGRVEALRKEIMSLDISGFETEAASVLEELYDLSRLSEMEPQIGELKQRIISKRDEERRRAEEDRRRRDEFRSKITGWKKLGFNVSALEGYLDGDMEFLRKEYSIARISIQRAQTILGELSSLPAGEAGPEHGEVRKSIYTLDRLDDCAERVERLRLASAELTRQRRKLEELRKKMRDWKEQGYDVSRLERMAGQDIEAVTKEFLMFKIRVQKLRELEEELRLLDTEGFESERSVIENDLRNVDALGEIRDRLSELELKIGKRMAEEVRLQEERRRLQGEHMAKMAAWLEEGFYVDQLEGALGKEPAEMAAEFRRFEESVGEIRQIRERLEELSGSGYDELIARIREKLRDVGRIEETKRDWHELWERIERRRKEAEGRRKEEDELRFNIVKQIEAWEAMGYEVRALEKLAGGRLEELRRGMINFRMRIERMQGLLGILDAMDTRGFESETAAIRAQLKDIDRAEEVENAIAALKEKIHTKKESERATKEKLHKRRDECTDRFLALLQQGYNVDTLEGALELPYEELSVECERLEGVVARLKQIEAEVGRRGLAAGNEAMLARLHDVNALPELEEWLATGKEPAEPRTHADRIQIIRYGHGAPARETQEPGRHAPAARPEPKPPVARKEREKQPEAAPSPPEHRVKETAPVSGPSVPLPEAEKGVPESARPATEDARAAPSLAAAVAGVEPEKARAPGAAAARPAEAAPAPATKCEGCGEPVDANWKKCPSCLRPLGDAGAKGSLPGLDKLTKIDRIPARPERDLGIRDESMPEKRDRSRRETPIDPEKLATLRKMIDQWKTQGDDIGDLEVYLNSGVVTKEGMRIRLEAINERSKRAEAGKGAAPAAAAVGDGPNDAAPEGPEGERAPPAPRTEDRPPAPAPPAEGAPEEPEPDGKQGAEPNGESGGANGGQPGEGVRKMKKVKKVAK